MDLSVVDSAASEKFLRIAAMSVAFYEYVSFSLSCDTVVVTVF